VTAAREHPNADKLLLVQVQLGDEERQIVAGIRGHYDPQALPGTQIVVLCNLEEVVLRGEESRGMLLAAAAGDDVVLLRPDRQCPPGATIK
jgi:methionyl-tRNA synthetase